jgi:hypothetical protein
MSQHQTARNHSSNSVPEVKKSGAAKTLSGGRGVELDPPRGTGQQLIQIKRALRPMLFSASRVAISAWLVLVND